MWALLTWWKRARSNHSRPIVNVEVWEVLYCYSTKDVDQEILISEALKIWQTAQRLTKRSRVEAKRTISNR